MSTLSRLTVLGGLLAAGLAQADTVNLVTTPAALGANDSVIWSPQLGPDGATIPNSFTATSVGGRTVGGAFTTTTGIVAQVCNACSWSPLSGDFNNNDFVVWSFDAGANAGTAPVTLTFPSMNGVGAVIQSDAPGQFTAKLELFNGATSLGFVTRTSDVTGDAIFIGALDVTAANATKAVFSLTAGPGDTTDFAIGPLSLNAPPIPVPDLLITKTHVGNFTQGQLNAVYTITVTNSGTAATTGTTTVSDTLPAGLTFVSGTGGGFTCSAVLQVVTCTDAAAIGAAASPAITLTVNVAANAAALVTNSATVSNPSILADADDTASDPTIINPLPPGTVLVSYAANLGSGQSVVNLTNAGTVNGFDPAGDICANVYVFAEDQQLIACCTCPLTPNHLKTLSVQKDLIDNTLTPGVPIGVTVELVATKGAACNASVVSQVNLAAGLQAWSTTLHAAPGGGFAVTETEFQPAVLSPSELAKLTSYCGFIQANGSTFGVCNACKEGAAGAAKQ